MKRKNQTQLSFDLAEFAIPKKTFGGKGLTSHPKIRRPLDSKMPVHLVLHANFSVLRLPKTFGIVQAIIKTKCEKYGIKIYKMANVGNHLHFVIKIGRIRHWAAFIRELTGHIARTLKAMDLAQGNCFWSSRPFTRIVSGWTKAFKSVMNYVYLNQLEAEGHIKRHETKTFRDLQMIWGNTG